MHTRNSPPQGPQTAAPPSETTNKAQWTENDEVAFIDYIAEHKAEAGDGMKFKTSFWTGAAKEMVAHSGLGGPRTASGCSSKWDRLKKAYNVIATIKANTSGFTWSDTWGLDISINESCAWKEYVAKNKDVAPFKNKGFPHFNRIQLLIPHTVKGLHAFRPSEQTHGAIVNSSLTAPSGSTATAGGMGPPAQPADDAQVSSDDEAVPPLSSIRSSPTIPSSAISKRKRLALDKEASTTSFGSKCTHRSTSSGASALVGIKDLVVGLGSSMLEGGMLQARPPRHHRKNSVEHRIEAMTLLQEKEVLTADQVIAFADLFEQNMLKADTYVALVRADVRKLWVERELADLGFPAVVVEE